jgi:hypothetical protein
LILDHLKSNGTPIPTNDIWIAVVAFQKAGAFYPVRAARFFEIVRMLVEKARE